MTGKAQERKPEMFDLPLNDHMDEAGDDTAKVLIEHKQAAEQKK